MSYSRSGLYMYGTSTNYVRSTALEDRVSVCQWSFKLYLTEHGYLTDCRANFDDKIHLCRDYMQRF